MNFAFYQAIARLPLGVVTTIEFLGPLGLAVIGSRRPRDVIWAVLAAAGVFLLAGGRMNADDAIGVGLAALAGLLWALYIVIGGRASRAWPDGRGLTVSMLTSTCLVVPAALVFGDVAPIIQSPNAIASGLAIAFLSTVVLFTLEMAALRRLRTATFGVLLSLEPAIAALVGFVFLAQGISAVDGVAIGLVAAASAGASWSGRSATGPHPVPPTTGAAGLASAGEPAVEVQIGEP